jgi:hypothetical protein
MQSLIDPGSETVCTGEVDIIIIFALYILGGKVDDSNVQALISGFVIKALFNIPIAPVDFASFIGINKRTIILEIEFSVLEWQIGGTSSQTVTIYISDPPYSNNPTVV